MSADTLRFAVIGSGPSGFYAAEALMRSHAPCSVDMFERLATPYGLVRYGVAPDHQKLKQVAAVFDGIAKDPRFRLLAGVEVGADIAIDELLARYHAVVLATGSPVGRELRVPNESLAQVFTSAKFVGWYNGHPDCASLRPDLAGRTALVVGNGNVALDVCRLLVRPYDELRSSDIPESVLPQFRRRGIRQVHVVGRGAAAGIKFTFKEFRQLVDQAGLRVQVPQGAAWSEADWGTAGSDDAARVAQWLRDKASRGDGGDGDGPCISFWFNAVPQQFCDERGRLSGVQLKAADAGGADVPAQLPCDVAVTCIGYEARPLSGMGGCMRAGAVSHRAGQVIGPDGADVPGLYVAGWAKRGPTGIIGTNRADSCETAQTLLERLPALATRPLLAEPIEALFAARGVQPLSFAQWLQIDQWERQRGAELGKPREKVVSSADVAAALGVCAQPVLAELG
jgi:ferredoxin--NADP+ reductase